MSKKTWKHASGLRMAYVDDAAPRARARGMVDPNELSTGGDAAYACDAASLEALRAHHELESVRRALPLIARNRRGPATHSASACASCSHAPLGARSSKRKVRARRARVTRPRMSRAALLLDLADGLSRRLAKLRFGPPITHVYDPLSYARTAHAAYLERYAEGPKTVLFVGMNPGPFGMTQTGVPFGEVAAVRDWLGIAAEIGKPKREHPKRKVEGFRCARSEVSGARFWGLWRALYGTPERFFASAFVVNYCPLVFMEESGRNVTPDKLAPAERAPLLAACDAALGRVIEGFSPRWVVGVGRFAEARAKAVGAPNVLVMPHPSPASPGANRNWAESAVEALRVQGLVLRAM